MAKDKRNKYLEDIGIKEYGTNFCNNKDDKRQKRWAKQRKKYGFDDRETWALDQMFIEWLYSRCMMYKEISPVDMEYSKIKYDGLEFTQEEAINIILSCAKDFLLYHEIPTKEDMIYKNMKYAAHLWAELFPTMWW